LRSIELNVNRKTRPPLNTITMIITITITHGGGQHMPTLRGGNALRYGATPPILEENRPRCGPTLTLQPETHRRYTSNYLGDVAMDDPWYRVETI
jgi:hypothetical protein